MKTVIIEVAKKTEREERNEYSRAAAQTQAHNVYTHEPRNVSAIHRLCSVCDERMRASEGWKGIKMSSNACLSLGLAAYETRIPNEKIISGIVRVNT